ncbi:MAG: Do family serine endopeptidase [Gemmatimonadaceae bacterium]
MSRIYARARLGLVASAAFVGGLVVAAGVNVTPFGYAQGRSSPPTTSRPPAQAVQPLTDASNAFVSISEHVTPAVVSISTRQERRNPRTTPGRPQPRGGNLDEFFDQFDPRRQAPQEGSGTGFLVSADGYILTNNHVVANADRVTVALQDKRVFTAKVIGRDPSTDVAVIKIEGAGFPTLSFGDDERARVGEWVLAIGNPLALDFTVTAGIISAKNRSGNSLRSLYESSYAIVDYIQTDAAINPGNSGGPLVNTRGEVIGINSAIASPTGTYSGYGFAIPITLARDVMEDLIKHGRVHRPELGVAITDVTPEDAQSAGLKEIRGVLVGGFNSPPGAQSPAERAGIEQGDVIVSVAGHTVDRVSTLQRFVRSLEPGRTIPVEVLRFGTRKTFQVRLREAASEEQVASAAERQDTLVRSPAYDKLGIAIEPLSSDVVRQARISDDFRGVLITDVDVDGPAYSRLPPQFVITDVLNPPRKRIRNVADLEEVLSRMRPGDVVSLVVYDVRDRAERKSTRVISVRVGD